MFQRLLKLKYIILFFIVSQILIMLIVTINEIHDREFFLKNKTLLAQTEYDTIYSKIKEQSEMIYQEIINKKEIIEIFQNAHSSDEKNQSIIREELYIKLLPSYNRLNKLIELKQLHFHLPNNHSFLRMHRPHKFGDDLTGIRETVAYVNKNKKPIDGFEEGRVYNGFRFVYPLNNTQGKHIGSIEVSFSASSFQNTLSNDTRLSQFIFSKEIIDKKVWSDELKSNYAPSQISPLFLIEKDSIRGEIKKKVKNHITSRAMEVFSKNLSLKRSYSIALNIEDETFILSFLPIKNPVNQNIAAYIVIITKSAYLHHLHFENKLSKVIAFAFLMSLFILIYRHYKHEDKFKEQQALLIQQSKMAQMGSMLSNIAHQWKQPLARINAKLLQIPFVLSLDKEDEKVLEKKLDEIENLTLYMGNTIENFRNYFHPKKKKHYFNLKNAIDRAIILVGFPKTLNDIDFSTDISHDIRVYNYEDEIIQVLITLLTNAKEAFDDKEIAYKHINISVTDKLSSIDICVLDNAGGIEDELLSKIFNPYFSTKDNTKNDGVGLYMAKTIVENSLGGKLTYTNSSISSIFCLTIKGMSNRYEK